MSRENAAFAGVWAVAPSLLLALSAAGAEGQDSNQPMEVIASIEPGTYYVGQVIPMTLRVRPGSDPPTVVLPSLDEAELIPSGTSSRQTDKATEHRFDYRVVPRRAGVLLVPSIRVESDGRVGRTRPIRCEIRPVPALGQTSAFLGGVGPVEVGAEARPDSVRAGEWIDYRLTLRGPGALGSIRGPTLGDLDALGLGLRVEPQPAERSSSPPEVTFRWRLRPTRAGRASLPPVPVATFDPRSGRFQTRVARGVPIQVAEVPALDPSAIEYGPPVPVRRADPLAMVAALAILSVAAGLLVAARRRARARHPNPRGLAGLLVRNLSRKDISDDPSAVAREVLDSLIAYLNAALGRPKGALTPAEVREAFSRAGLDESVAEAAGRVVVRCDRASFAGEVPPPDEARSIRDDAIELLGRLAGAGPETPREAPGTA